MQNQITDVVSHKDWGPRGVARCIASSAFFFVGIMEDGCTVLKYPHEKTPELLSALREESVRYSRIKPHPNIVTHKGMSEDGLLLEYCELGELLDLINGPPLSANDLIRIAREVTCGITHLHQQGFIHSDLNVRNVFITSGRHAKIGDMQGQLYRSQEGIEQGEIELPAISQENVKSRHPAADDDEFSVRTDIFALGTLLYHMWYGTAPFPELNEFVDAAEIRMRYQAGLFPVVASGGMDQIIYQCWISYYKDGEEILQDLFELETMSTRQVNE